MEDAEIMAEVARGDAEAWRLLLERHGAFVLGLAERRLRRAGFGRADAEEVIQELWVVLLRGAARAARLDGGLRAYLAISALNQARTWLRGRARTSARDRSLPVATGDAADDPLLRSESIERLNEALGRMNPEDRLLLRWAYWDGLSYEGIGRLMGISPNGVGPFLTRARDRLKALLESGKSCHGHEPPRRLSP